MVRRGSGTGLGRFGVIAKNWPRDLWTTQRLMNERKKSFYANMLIEKFLKYLFLSILHTKPICYNQRQQNISRSWNFVNNVFGEFLMIIKVNNNHYDYLKIFTVKWHNNDIFEWINIFSSKFIICFEWSVKIIATRRWVSINFKTRDNEKIIWNSILKTLNWSGTLIVIITIHR